jgi:hypothetical protein
MNLTAKAYRDIIHEAVKIYPTLAKIEALLINAQIPRGEIKLTDTGVNRWDSILAYTDRNDLHKQLMQVLVSENSNNQFLYDLLASIENGTAFMPPAPLPDAGTTASAGPPWVFFILEQADKDYYTKLNSQLKPLSFNKSLRLDGNTLDLEGGAEIPETIRQKMLDADIIILLVTADFMGSDHCMQLLYEAYEMKKRVIPTLISPCLWARISILEHIQPLPKNGKPVLEWPLPDKAYMEIAMGIEEVALNITKSKSADV